MPPLPSNTILCTAFCVPGLLCAAMLTRRKQKATSARAFFVARGVSDAFIRSAAETLFTGPAQRGFIYIYIHFREKPGSATPKDMKRVFMGNWVALRLLHVYLSAIGRILRLLHVYCL